MFDNSDSMKKILSKQNDDGNSLISSVDYWLLRFDIEKFKHEILYVIEIL